MTWSVLKSIAETFNLDPNALLVGRGVGKPTASGTAAVRAARLPTGLGPHFGRRAEKRVLTDAWVSPERSIVYLEGVGGSGKTSIVRSWLDEFLVQNPSSRTYAFSFNGPEQAGAADTSTAFFSHAFGHFGLGEPDTLSPDQRAERLADRVLSESTVFVLDGVEMLQRKSGHPQEGTFFDSDMRLFLRTMAFCGTQARRLLIVTTQLRLADLRSRENSFVNRLLMKPLDFKATRKILRFYGISGREGTVARPLHRYTRGHPLTLHLLASYIEDRFGRDGRRWRECWSIEDDPRAGVDAQWVMKKYEAWFADDRRKLQLLRLVSLFDSAVTISHLRDVLAVESVPQLTNALGGISQRQLEQLAGQLARARLLMRLEGGGPSVVDTHVIVREHFRESLKKNFPGAWKKGNSLLFQRYKQACKGPARTKKDTTVLYAAIRYGCRAGQFEKALRGVYKTRIHGQQGSDAVVRRYGLFADDLSTLYSFFDLDRGQPVTALTEPNRRFVLQQTATRLRWVGRLGECCELMEQLVGKPATRTKPEILAVPLRYIAESRLMRGELQKAEEFAKRAVQVARRGTTWIDHVAALTILASSLFHSGQGDKATRLFEEAEALQKKHERTQPFLHSSRGFRYHELLLDQERYDEVITRCERNMQRKPKNRISDAGPVDKGICWLGIGLAKLRKFAGRAGRQASGLKPAAEAIQSCIDFFEEAQRREFVYQGRLARAELLFEQDEYDASTRELEYVLYEAGQDEMFRIVAECRLQLALVAEAWGISEQAAKYRRLFRRDVARLGLRRLANVAPRFGLR